MWTKIKMMFSSIWGWVLPLLQALSSNVGKVVLSEAIKVCGNVAITMASASGPDKYKVAFQTIVANLKTQGLEDLQTSVVNSAIETAVQYLKSKQ